MTERCTDRNIVVEGIEKTFRDTYKTYAICLLCNNPDCFHPRQNHTVSAINEKHAINTAKHRAVYGCEYNQP